MNPWEEGIQQARDAALAILQPSESQLEHGLALHRDALVCESYSLGLQAPIDGEAVAKAVESGASEVELQYLSERMRMTRWAADDELKAEYLAAWEASGVTCSFQNTGEEGNDPMRMLGRLAHYTHLTDRMRDHVARAAFPGDIAAAKAAGRHCIYQTCNGVPLPGEQATVEQELRFVSQFFELGCRMMHLTYNRRNPIGDGCAEPANAGLSDFGRAVIAEMNEVGVIIDVAHTGWRTCLEAAEASRKPIVSSHSACAALNHHHRCKPDEVMRAIADKGGTLGITNVPAFLGGSGCIDAMLDHVDHAVKVVGADHVTIGTDRAYVSCRTREENAKVKVRRGVRRRWEALWPADDPVGRPEWRREPMVQSMAWTNFPLFTVGLVQRGYSDDDIRRILGGNILRVAREVLGEAG